MLYKKNGKELDMELFKNPTAEYRATPFWSWNCELNRDMLLRQIEYLKQMGFGGFHMHSRAGMATEYLSDEFMELVKACTEKAKKENMLAWLYDEDRWSSGFAGGYVTKNKAHRQKMLVLSENAVPFVSKEEGTAQALPYLVTCFDIELDKNGKLAAYRQIGEHDEAKGIKRYAYVRTEKESGWRNNQTYVDTLSNEAMQSFIDITYEAYKKAVGDDFGGAVPAIFTDEPNFGHKDFLSFAESHDDVRLPWTTDFADTYLQAYGEDLIAKLPELVWDLPDGRISVARYHYHDHVCERFAAAFADQCGKWCDENGIALTGHMLAEMALASQTPWVSEAMRSYRTMAIPGIDMLCNNVELTTAKQTQSAVHQYGREAMLSELYGVTNWDFDFRGHKFQGDWQAALGVTVRVPHLSWVSMKGSAKRDYPASINYQSPWYREYAYVEDHFARLNTVLTRGKAVVNVGVIHPIESYWLHYGPSDTGSDIRQKQDSNFLNLAEWLLRGMVDFDYLCESLLPQQCGTVTDTLNVGCMSYSTVIVPACETIRRTTFDLLKQFAANGGKLIFMGECPTMIDAVPTDEVKALYDQSITVGFEELDILNVLQQEQTAKILNQNGESVKNLVHALRKDGDVNWLFLAHVEMSKTPDVPVPEELTIILDGSYRVEWYDTIDGTVKPIDYETKDGKTYISKTLYASDSLLLKLTAGEGSYCAAAAAAPIAEKICFLDGVSYSREEDNVYLMDMAAYSIDGGELQPTEEMLRIDLKCRDAFGYPMADGRDAQPWVLGPDVIEHYVNLVFKVNSEIELQNVYIAGEEAEEIKVNGQSIALTPCGWYVDESIHKYAAGTLCKGENTIEIKAPIGKRTSLENYFLLGDFDVAVRGCKKVILPPSTQIGFGDITHQGLPFYGGNLTYRAEIETPDCDVSVCVSRYRGALVKVMLDGNEEKTIAYEPYKAMFKNVSAGRHTLTFKVFGNRANTFGAVHNCSYSTWYGSNMWYTKDAEWSYEYVLKETGILASPVVTVKKA